MTDAQARAILRDAAEDRAGGAGCAAWEDVRVRRTRINCPGVLAEAAYDVAASRLDPDDPLRLALAHVVRRDIDTVRRAQLSLHRREMSHRQAAVARLRRLATELDAILKDVAPVAERDPA